MGAPDDTLPTSRRVCLVCQAEYPADEKRCAKDGTMLVALVSDPYIGKTLNNSYAVQSTLGHGGTSVVYKAEHLQLQRTVAIKMLKAHLVTDEESKKRFEQEAKAVSCLSHPHVVNVFDVGITRYGEPFIVMEYLQGTALSDLIKNDGRMDVRRALHVFIQACSALAHAHSKRVVHRDVKPSNIMLTKTDQDPDYVKIVDFGMAKLRSLTGEFQQLTRTGEIFGSPVYMSPEQCTGRKLDERTDVYSMGVVMYETLAGRPPFKDRTQIDTIRRQIKEPPPRFEEVVPDAYISPELEAVVMRCLSKNPDDRFQTMEELKAALEKVQAAVAPQRSSASLPTSSAHSSLQRSSAAPPAPAAVSGGPVLNKRMIAIVGGVAAVILAAIAVFMHH